MSEAGQRDLVQRLVREHGRTFAQDAGIALDDSPAPLWQLLVLVQLLSARIAAPVAVASARELFSCGWTSAEALRASTWRQRVDALGRGGYRRYDFSTATRLDANASLLLERWQGDLRVLRDEARGDATGIGVLLRSFDGIGPVAAAILLREVQAVWPSVRPFADALVLKGAALAGLPADADRLASLAGTTDLAPLGAALVRVARRPALLDA